MFTDGPCSWEDMMACYDCRTYAEQAIDALKDEPDGGRWRISDPETAEGDIRELIQATKVSDPFTISYELQLFTICRKAHEPVVLSRQGSNEYFGGYAGFVVDDEGNYESSGMEH